MPRSPDPVRPVAGAALSVARRRLLRGSLGVAPVLMVSAPRSVMAGTGMCTPASSFASINASRPDALLSCAGKTPAYWVNANESAWPAPYKKNGNTATTFSSVFGPPVGVIDANATFFQVLSFGDNTGDRGLAKYIAAAALNAAVPGLVPQEIASLAILKSIYNAYRSPGWYAPTAGIQWFADYAVPVNAGGITPWLQSTMVMV